MVLERPGKRLWVPLGIFVGIMVLGAYLIQLNLSVRENEQRQVTQQIMLSQVAEIERNLSYTMTSTYILGQEVIRTNGQFLNFEHYAASVLDQLPGIANLQLAPEGITTDVYPFEGDEAAVGYNIFEDERWGAEATRAVETGVLTLAGPFELSQGGSGVVGRYPVYLDENGEQKFWGFVSAVIRLDDLIDKVGLSTIVKQGFGYEFGHWDARTNTPETISREGVLQESHTEYSDIIVPNGTWFLKFGRSDTGFFIFEVLAYLFTFFIAAAAAAMSRKVIDEPERLRTLVGIQTRDLQHLAYHDSLTDVRNRHYFNDQCLMKPNTSGQPDDVVALLLIDLDGFKEINDTLGHEIGDLLLIEAANRIDCVLPQNSTVARLGGDEFVVMLRRHDDDVDADDLEHIAGAISDALGSPYELDSNLVHVSASIGTAWMTDEIDDLIDLLRCTDHAMYDAKQKGKGQVSHFSKSIQETAQRHTRLKNDLKSAIENGELRVVYQPIQHCSTDAIHKAEALLRWEHPELGNISPLEFIPIAEQCGIIVDIGNWVFETVAKQVKQWQITHNVDVQVSVNVSPVQFRTDEHTSRWMRFLKEIDLDGRHIIIEITEGILLDDCPDMRRQLDNLRTIGVQFALDDFGTGYSSLSYLKSFPLDYLKIDRSFVKNLDGGNDDMFLCEMILSLARRFGLEVVAEGVETQHQLDLLSGQGCDYVQGYLISAAVSADVLEADFLSLNGYDSFFQQARAA